MLVLHPDSGGTYVYALPIGSIIEPVAGNAAQTITVSQTFGNAILIYDSDHGGTPIHAIITKDVTSVNVNLP